MRSYETSWPSACSPCLESHASTRTVPSARSRSGPNDGADRRREATYPVSSPVRYVSGSKEGFHDRNPGDRECRGQASTAAGASRHGSRYLVSRSLYVVAELAIADHLAEGPKTALGPASLDAGPVGVVRKLLQAHAVTP